MPEDCISENIFISSMNEIWIQNNSNPARKSHYPAFQGSAILAFSSNTQILDSRTQILHFQIKIINKFTIMMYGTEHFPNIKTNYLTVNSFYYKQFCRKANRSTALLLQTIHAQAYMQLGNNLSFFSRWISFTNTFGRKQTVALIWHSWYYVIQALNYKIRINKLGLSFVKLNSSWC